MWMISRVVLFLFVKGFLVAMTKRTMKKTTTKENLPGTQFLYQFRQNYRQTVPAAGSE
ncbi:MAG: hypothetical protein WBW01_01210 [Terriglobales bacterium]